MTMRDDLVTKKATVATRIVLYTTIYTLLLASLIIMAPGS